MPYTATQLIEYHATLFGRPPNLMTTDALRRMAERNATGDLSDAATLKLVFAHAGTIRPVGLAPPQA